jgi:hypothetical protein
MLAGEQASGFANRESGVPGSSDLIGVAAEMKATVDRIFGQFIGDASVAPGSSSGQRDLRLEWSLEKFVANTSPRPLEMRPTSLVRAR